MKSLEIVDIEALYLCHCHLNTFNNTIYLSFTRTHTRFFRFPSGNMTLATRSRTMRPSLPSSLHRRRSSPCLRRRDGHCMEPTQTAAHTDPDPPTSRVREIRVAVTSPGVSEPALRRRLWAYRLLLTVVNIHPVQIRHSIANQTRHFKHESPPTLGSEMRTSGHRRRTPGWWNIASSCEYTF